VAATLPYADESRMRTAFNAALAALAACAVLPAAANAACTPKSNLEAIVDDSGSMEYNDPDNLRISAMELLMDTQGNEKRTLGAIEFGSAAKPLFGPGLIGQNAPAYKAALHAALLHDGEGTDYNAAFAAAGPHNPTANARIFLTDGEHTADAPYANGHRGGPPTYVIGLGVGTTGSPFDALLKQIAADTGGLYRRADDAGALQATMFDLNSAIACQTPPKRFADTFRKAGKPEAHSVTIPSRINAAQFALTWTNTADKFTIGSFQVIRRGKVVAHSARVRKLKVSRRRGATFTTVRVTGLVPGKLRFSVKATKLSARGVPVALTTQVARRATR
jgi:hypothetical protein